jgi:anthranilate phosphoribosyltransferase
MSLVRYIKEIAHGAEDARDLPEESAYELFAAVLDGGVPDIELGAILMSLRFKTESVPELFGFHRAMSERVYALHAPAGALRPAVFASYNGARSEPNLLPLLALMLQRLGIPVLLHGTLEGSGRVATAYILRELGVLPCASLAQAQSALDDDLLAFVPTAVLSPGLAALLSLRSRLGVRNTAHNLVKLLDPFQEEGVRVASASRTAFLDKLEVFFVESGAEALLLKSTEGEPFANPRRRPRMTHIHGGNRAILFDEEAAPSRTMASLPTGLDAPATAAWIRQALAGAMPIPHPLMNQLACCLYACGYTDDLNQAKAIAAVEAGGLLTPGGGGGRPRAAAR